MCGAPERCIPASLPRRRNCGIHKKYVTRAVLALTRWACLRHVQFVFLTNCLVPRLHRSLVCFVLACRIARVAIPGKSNAVLTRKGWHRTKRLAIPCRVEQLVRARRIFSFREQLRQPFHSLSRPEDAWGQVLHYDIFPSSIAVSVYQTADHQSSVPSRTGRTDQGQGRV